ncbi:MAG: hypothetical protein IJ300_07890 [Clostridia bacterium]|nr:hypothetical protein [Clostridia bacterium]
MKRKTIIIVSISAIVLLIVSICIGLFSVAPVSNSEPPLSSPEVTGNPTTDENITDTFVPEEKGDYKIILSGDTLQLYNKDELINQTSIAPDVLPRADIKALSLGIEYYTLEEALLDWESLCK